MRKKKKILLAMIAVTSLVFIWGATFTTDYLCITHGKDAVFAIKIADDGRSTTRIGLFYSVKIDDGVSICMETGTEVNSCYIQPTRSEITPWFSSGS